jgi:hypothetical protein
MSVVEEIKRLSAFAQDKDAEGRRMDEFNQLRDLQEVEAALKEIGVSLEPTFDISLTARIGAAARR